jgi:hypothetical protein
MSEEPKDRMAFFRALSLGTLAGGAGLLFAKAVRSGQDCIGDGKCKICLSLKKCELPLAHDHRKQESKVNIKGVKGSLSYKRDLIRKLKESNPKEEQHHA